MDPNYNHTIAPTTDEQLYHAIGRLAADAGLSPPLFLKTLKTDVRSTAHPRRALTNYHRFLMTGFSSAWLRDFDAHQLLQQILLELFSQSQFLADLVVRNPELFRWLTSSNVLKITKTSREYSAEAADAIGLFQRSEKKLDSLKRFQRRELLRIGARQILKEADVATTSGELSALADAIIGSVLELAYGQLAEAVGSSIPRELAVIGLGKLGGGELNFSSDIDLMFVYEKDAPLGASQLRLTTLHEYYCRVAEYVVRYLSEHTSEGHLYRVDMRLRPDGSSGPLAMSRPAYWSYYESRGELWERQMLIKARVIAGNREVGDGWMAEIQPFIFPRTLLTSPLEEISRIKKRIESNLDDETNIKLGSGGIRDIEFTVQALQLLNGGINVNLRQRNTLEALRQLGNLQLLRKREALDLEAAYRFLRTVEDRLQLLHGLQRHSIPESAEERRILARQLGYNSSAMFSGKLEAHQARVRTSFRSVFGSKNKVHNGNETGGGTLSVDPALFRRLRIRKGGAASEHLASILNEMPDLRDAGRLKRFAELIRSHEAPDWALKNFLQLASSAPIRRTLQQAALNEKILDVLLILCSRTSKYAGLLAREPLLFEALMGRPESLLEPGAGWTFLESSDPVRYKLYNEFKSVLRLIVGEITIPDFTRELSGLADAIVKVTWEKVIKELNLPADFPAALIALGKFGGEEISITSDLDLILLYRDGGVGSKAKIANTLGRSFRAHLENVYDADFRLRPEGKNAPLATEFEYYKDYFDRRASLWERQSLVKARFVAGDVTFADEVMATISRSAYETSLPKGWKKEILLMRKRMEKERSRTVNSIDLKVGSGGLVDLEFLIQVLLLKHGHASPGIRKTNSFDALDSLKAGKIIMKRDLVRIQRNLEFFRRLEAYVRMNAESTEFILPTDPDSLQAVAAAMGSASPAALRSAVQSTRQSNRRLLGTIVRHLPA